jgi:hypothetical protein
MPRPGRLQRSGSKRGLDPTGGGGGGDNDDHAPKRPRIPALARCACVNALILLPRVLSFAKV